MSTQVELTIHIRGDASATALDDLKRSKVWRVVDDDSESLVVTSNVLPSEWRPVLSDAAETHNVLIVIRGGLTDPSQWEIDEGLDAMFSDRFAPSAHALACYEALDHLMEHLWHAKHMNELYVDAMQLAKSFLEPTERAQIDRLLAKE